MVRVVFKNLEKSEFIKDIVSDKITHALEKFPELENATATVTVGMENSPFHAGADLFQVRVILLARGLKPIVLEKQAGSPYQAVAVLTDRLFEVLHRAVERRREKSRSERRRWKGSPHLGHEWRSVG
ncbi:MAG: HPF/RaiA family ribosome-associated protein [Bdellovibrionaceae bacterium]|nr:HPF/RaiA family ribosome-associated protein [Pseudobdellovibrionaceae bacterium]